VTVTFGSIVPVLSEPVSETESTALPAELQSAPASAPVPWTWLAGFSLLGLLLRLIAINQQLWFDEIITLLNSARAPLAHIVTHYTGQNQHTLYSILAHGSIRLLGDHPWTLRLPAVLFGVACIPALYFFGRLVTAKAEALAACALMTVNYQHVWFSQNARGYTAMAFWTLVTSTFFLRSVRGSDRRNRLVYGVTAALGIYTHLMMIFVIAAHAVVYLWMVAGGARSRRGMPRPSRAPIYGFALAILTSLLLYAPVIPVILSHNVGPAREHVRYEWASPVWAAAELLRGLRTATAGGWLALAVGGFVALCGAASYWRQNRYVAGLMILPGVLTAAAILATRHNFWPRFFFFEIGFVLLIVVRGAMLTAAYVARRFGASESVRSATGLALIALLLLASVVPLRAAYRYPKQDYLGALKFVEQHKQAAEAVATAGVVASPYQRYYRQQWPMVETTAQLDHLLAGGHGAWLLYSMPDSIRTSQPELWRAIASKFSLVRKCPGTLAGGDIYVSHSQYTEVNAEDR
jgi:4-amino-4-deoxy-L-arabinose transferase-like glycosyltransferase